MLLTGKRGAQSTRFLVDEDDGSRKARPARKHPNVSRKRERSRLEDHSPNSEERRPILTRESRSIGRDERVAAKEENRNRENINPERIARQQQLKT